MAVSNDDRLLEDLLAEHPQVEDYVVRRRTTEAGTVETVAYIVAPRPEDVESWLADAIRQRGDAGAGHERGVTAAGVTVVPVSSLPLLSGGALDVEALEALPVVDPASVEHWESEILAVPGVTGAAVVPVEWAPESRPFHLADIVAPDDAPTAARGASRAAATSPARESDEAKAGASAESKPAVSLGAELRQGGGQARTLPDTLSNASRESADRGLRYVRGDGSTEVQSYRALIDDSERLLAGLRDLGLRPGDRALFQFQDNRDFLTTLWACFFAGVIPVPVGVAPTYAERNAVTQKLAAAWEMLGRPVVLTSARLTTELRDFGSREGLDGFRVEPVESLRRSMPDGEWHESRPDDVAIIMLTSGSTGTPKGVKLTHSNLLARSAGSVQMNGFTRDEVTLNWMPLDHVAGILFFHLRDVYLACDQLHAPTDVILGDPLAWMDLIHRHRCSITFAPNFAFSLVNDRSSQVTGKEWDLSCLRAVLNGAEPIVARTARRFMELLAPFGLPPTAMVPAWGMSEVSSGVTYSADFSTAKVRDEDSFVDVGRPIPGVSLRVVDDLGRLVPEGAIGNLEVSGNTLMTGYYDSALDGEAFTDDGWFRTGDLAVIRDGSLTITGRSKDVIIINSVNYYSHELESVVEGIGGVSTSFVAAVPVREAGEDTDQLAIFFHGDAASDSDLLELMQKIRQQCIRQVGANPTYVLPVRKDQIPKTEIGKIQRPLLVKRFAEGEFDGIRKDMDLLARNDRTLPRWFFRRTWQRAERRPSTRGTTRETCVVFVDEDPLGREVCAGLERRGNDVVTVEVGGDFRHSAPGRFEIDPADPMHYERLFADLRSERRPVTLVLHTWTAGERHDEGGVGAAPTASPGLRLGAFSLLHTIQALARGRVDAAAVHVLTVSSRAQAVDEAEAPDPARAATLGIVKSAPQELAWLRCRHVDVDPAHAVTADDLLAEALAAGAEPEVAYRKGERYVARLEPVELSGPPPRPLFKRGGAYLLTGGLGGIGFEVARFLLERFDARLLLVSRSELCRSDGGSGSEPGTEEARSRFRTLGGLGGSVRHAAVDVADADGLRAAVEGAERGWGGPLDGVIHMAGVYAERGILEESVESFQAVLHPKIGGTTAISSLLEDRPHAFLLGFSSVVGFFGGAFVSAYSAANAALEAALAPARAPGDGQRVCMSWSTWEDVGISRAFRGESLLRAKGYLPVTVREGLHSIQAAASRNGGVTYAGLDASSPNVRRWINATRCGRRQVTAFYVTDARVAGSSARAEAVLAGMELRDRYGTPVSMAFEPVDALPLLSDGTVDRASLGSAHRHEGSGEVEAPESNLEITIARIWKSTLRRERLDVRDNFFDLGGNSLLLSQVGSALSTELSRDVSLTELFQYTTVRTLADYLAGGPSGTADLESTIARGSARKERLQARRRKSRSQ